MELDLGGFTAGSLLVDQKKEKAFQLIYCGAKSDCAGKPSASADLYHTIEPRAPHTTVF